MRRASRDCTKYLRGSEEMGGGGVPGGPHEGPLHAAPPPPPAASRCVLAALLGLGLGQVVCSVALFLYFRAQVSVGSRPAPAGETESGRADRDCSGRKRDRDGGRAGAHPACPARGCGAQGAGRARPLPAWHLCAPRLGCPGHAGVNPVPETALAAPPLWR